LIWFHFEGNGRQIGRQQASAERPQTWQKTQEAEKRNKMQMTAEHKEEVRGNSEDGHARVQKILKRHPAGI
jgi:hypothetical protein